MTENTTENTETKPVAPAAFVVGFTFDGMPFIDLNASALAFKTEREPTLAEVRRYLSEVLMDLSAQATAEYVAARMAPRSSSGLITPEQF